MTSDDVIDEVFSVWLWDVMGRPDRNWTFSANSREAKLRKWNRFWLAESFCESVEDITPAAYNSLVR